MSNDYKPNTKTKLNTQNNIVKFNKSIYNQCASIRSSDEPHLRCLMKTKNGEKYCAMHLCQKYIVDYNIVDDDILELDMKMSKSEKNIINPIIKKLSLNVQPQPINIKNDSNKELTMHEQKVSTIQNSLKENEDELEIKLLILINDGYSNTLARLIGPIFQDITLSEDEQDPVTYDVFWLYKDGKKIPSSSINKYFLFSYTDTKNKIRCFTIFTIYNMLKDNNLIHPITMEEIPDKDIKRAKRLIKLYETKIGLFNENDSNLSPEFKLKNRLTKLFKQFYIHNIYLEENWLLSINNKDKLYRIISETGKLVSNNIKSINPNLHNIQIFQMKKCTKIKSELSVFELQEYIVSEWEKLIQAADSPQNQIPIWVLASGLSFVVPQIKQKYPDLEIMLM